MTARPSSIEEWVHLVPHLLDDDGWRPILAGASTALLHCSCPWGGTLVKISFLEHSEDLWRVLVRPEVASWETGKLGEWSHVTLEEQLALGDAVVHMEAPCAAVRLLAALFGATGMRLATEMRVRTWRDFPQRGDVAQTITSLCESDAMTFCRPTDKGAVHVYHILRVPGSLDYSESVTAQLEGVLQSGKVLAPHLVHRPGISDIRQHDQHFYLILTIQSCKRGMPLLPVGNVHAHGEHVTTIDAGKGMGLTTWARYDPAMVGSDRFFLSEYLQQFAKSIGESLEAYQSLNGQELLFFQCAVAREEWSRVQPRIQAAYRLQKTAYRHLNGGVHAPGLVEGGAPRFCPDKGLTPPQGRIARHQPKAQVRKMFFEGEPGLDCNEAGAHIPLFPNSSFVLIP